MPAAESAAPFAASFFLTSTATAIGATMPTTTTPSQNANARSPATRRMIERDSSACGAIAIHATYKTMATAITTTPASARVSANRLSSSSPFMNTSAHVRRKPIPTPVPRNMTGRRNVSHTGRAAITYVAPATRGSTTPTTAPMIPKTLAAPSKLFFARTAYTKETTAIAPTANSSRENAEPMLPRICKARSGCPRWNAEAQPPTAIAAKATTPKMKRTFLNLPLISPMPAKIIAPDETPKSTLKISKGH